MNTITFSPDFVAGRNRELIIADGTAPEILELLQGAQVPYVVIGECDQPLRAISTVLAGEQLDTLHIVAHGQAGGFEMGGKWVDEAALLSHAHFLAKWNVQQIALWSCEVGADSRIANTLARLTRASVLASDKPLGQTDQGSNWKLSGACLATGFPFDVKVAVEWPHQLVSLLFSASAYFAEDSAAVGSAKADLEENSLKLTGVVNGGSATKFLFTSDPASAPLYSGNNVLGTLYAINNNNEVVGSYVGEMSRLCKTGSSIEAGQFYVYPTGTTNTGDPATTILIDFGIAPAGTFAVGKTIGTSSDPVDTALNSLIPPAPSVAANADNGDVQLASLINEILSPESALPTGNVITGVSDTGTNSTPDSGFVTNWSIDTTPNPDKLVATISGLNVSNIKAVSAAGSTVSVLASGTTFVQGKYGALSISADGTYSYDVNGANSDLLALDVGSSLLDVFTYTITQPSSGKTASNTLTIRIDGGNDAPTVTAVNGAPAGSVDLITTPEDTEIILGLNDFGTFSDVDGDALKKIEITNLPSKGDLYLNGVLVTSPTQINVADIVSGKLSYRPVTNENGSAYTTFDFKVSDGTTWSTSEYKVTVNVTPVNDPPVVADVYGDTAAVEAGCVNAGSVQRGDLLSTNVADPDVGSTPVITAISSPFANTTDTIVASNELSVNGQFGSLTVNVNSGEYTYTPFNNLEVVNRLNPEQTLTEDFTFTVSDQSGGTDTAKLTIVIDGANDDPDAVDDANAMKEGALSGGNYGTTSGNVLGNDTDVDSGDTAGLKVQITGGDTPPTGGTQDLVLVSPIASVTYTVTETPTSDSWTATVDTTYAGFEVSTDGGANFNIAYRLDGMTPLQVLRSSSGLGATLVFDDPVSLYQYPADAIYRYVVAQKTALWNLGINATFSSSNTVTVVSGDSSLFTVGYAFSGYSSFGIPDGTQVTAVSGNTITLDAAVTLDNVTVTLADPTATGVTVGDDEIYLEGLYGYVIIDDLGNYTYTLTDNSLQHDQTHVETFNYTTLDPDGCSDTAVLRITVTGATTVLMSDDTGSVAEDIDLNVPDGPGDLLDDDTGVDTITGFSWGGQTALAGEKITIEGVGELTINDNGSYLFHPALNYTGAVPVATYNAVDSVSGDVGAATLTLTITASNDAPTASNDTVTTNEDTPYVFTLNDFGTYSDVEGSALANIQITALPVKGTLLYDGNPVVLATKDVFTAADIAAGKLTFVPANNENGNAYTTIAFRVQDGSAYSTSAYTVTVNVTPVNDPPVNAVPSAQTLNPSPALAFTTSLEFKSGNSNLVSVADVDENLYTVTLSVSYGHLNVTVPVSGTGSGVSVSGNGTGTVTLSANGGTAADLNAVLAKLVYTANDLFAGNDRLIVSTTDLDNQVDVDSISITVAADDRPLNVVGSHVNEASPFVMFSVTGAAGQYVKLSLADDTTDMGKDYSPSLEYYDGEGWQPYQSGSYFALPAGTTYVRVPVLQDSDKEGSEALTLTAINQAGHSTATGGGANPGTSTIQDDGAGDIYLEGATDLSPSPDTDPDYPAQLDDDRPLTVNNIEVNEGSSHAVFTVGGADGQKITLATADVVALKGSTPTTSIDGTVDYSSTLEYWDGDSWESASGTLTMSGTTMYVRTVIVNDSTYENIENFRLIASNASGRSTVGTATINDAGGGVKFTFTDGNPAKEYTGAPVITGLDDDRPVVSVSSVTVSEASPFAVVKVSLSNASNGVITFTPTLQSDTATVGADTRATPSGAALEYFDGEDWVSAASGVTIAAGQTSVLLRAAIENDTVFESTAASLEAFNVSTGAITGGVKNPAGTSGTVTIKDDGSSTNTFTEDNTTDTPTEGEANNDFVDMSAEGGSYNEGSKYAVFTVTANEGRAVNLSVSDGSADLVNGTPATQPGMLYSVDGGLTWVAYAWNGTSGARPVAPEGGKILVAVELVREQDDVYEGQEGFNLLAVDAVDSHTASGSATIRDNGTGAVVALDGNGLPLVTTPGSVDLDTEAVKDDDRPVVSVSSVTVSEASPFAVVKVSLSNASNSAITFTPTLQSDTATVGVDTKATPSGAALEYYKGAAWVSAASGVTIAAGQTSVLLRAAIENDTVFESTAASLEAFNVSTGAIAGGVKNPTGASGAVTIKDDGSSTNTFELDNTTDTPTVGEANNDFVDMAVEGGAYNEGSKYAVFTVTANEGRAVNLSVNDVSADLVNGTPATQPGMLYSVDGGLNWVPYTWNGTSGARPVAPEGGKILVAVELVREQDDIYEGQEGFNLVAVDAVDSHTASGSATIRDNGTGAVVALDGNGLPLVTTPGSVDLDTNAVKDDDRNGLTVVGGVYNEASAVALFTVTAPQGELLTLTLSDVDTTGINTSGLIRYSTDGGATWVNYSGPFAAPINGNPILVAVDIAGEQDAPYEGSEQFKLLVSAGAASAEGTSTIKDDGTGAVYNSNGTLNTDTPPEDDFNADLDPVSDDGVSNQDKITSIVTPDFTLNGGDRLVEGGTARLLGPAGNVVGSVGVTAADVAAGTVNVTTQQLDDGVYTFLAQILDASGNVVAAAPVTVTIVTDLDGVMPSVELAANGGDFNGDGVADWTQNNVAQLPLASLESFNAGSGAPDSSFGALLAGDVNSANPGEDVALDEGAQLLNISLTDLPAPVPTDVVAVTPNLNFSVTARAGGSLADMDTTREGLQTRVIIDLQPGGVRANTFMKWDAESGTWFDYLDDGNLSTYDDGATLLDLNSDGLIDRVVVTLTDGGIGDEDGVANGVIVDPGVLAYREPDSVYCVRLANGDRYYTTDASEAAEKARGTGNVFEGSRFDSLDALEGGLQRDVYYNPFTGDWFFAADGQPMPYACYVHKDGAGFAAATAGQGGGVDFHLFMNGRGITQLVTLQEASTLGLSGQGYTDRGVLFNTTTENAFVFDAEAYLVANKGNADIQTFVNQLSTQFNSTSNAGFVEAVEQHYLNQVELVGLAHGGSATAADLNAAFGTQFLA